MLEQLVPLALVQPPMVAQQLQARMVHEVRCKMKAAEQQPPVIENIWMEFFVSLTVPLHVCMSEQRSRAMAS
jgi:hypothetical protein